MYNIAPSLIEMICFICVIVLFSRVLDTGLINKILRLSLIIPPVSHNDNILGHWPLGDLDVI